MKTNVAKKSEPIHTHGGSKAVKITPLKELKRSVLSCMLWENEFYESGVTIANRIAELVAKVKPADVAELAVYARSKGKLRHVPLWLVRSMSNLATHKSLVSKTLAEVIQRPDELSEMISLYWKVKKQPLSAQVKKGLAKAFLKFNSYSLAKYNKDSAITLKDVMALCHSVPQNEEQSKMFRQLIGNYCVCGHTHYNKDKRIREDKCDKCNCSKFVLDKLPAPETWEVMISATKGKNKKEAWEKLLRENKLLPLALIRNLRNFQESDVDMSLVKDALLKMKVERVLPFRFITAAKYAPKLEPQLEMAMLKCLEGMEKLPGKTILIIDISGSMHGAIGGKSELNRMEAASALAMLAREQCEDCVIYATAGNDGTRIHRTKLLPARHGFAIRDLINSSYHELGGGGIFLTQCMDYVYKAEKTADRVIVFTDEQDCDHKLNPATANAFGNVNYLVNIASAKNGIGYGKWVHVDGFSEAVLDFICEYEKVETSNQ